MEKYLTTSEAAKMADVSIDTIRRWEAKGYIKSFRTKGGHRRYSKDSILSFINIKLERESKISVIYMRSKKEESQSVTIDGRASILTTYCKNKNISYEIISDIGYGVDYSRKGFKELIRLIETNSVDKIIVFEKNDLLTIGYSLFDEICKHHGVEILSLTNSEDSFVDIFEDAGSQAVLDIANELYNKDSWQYANLLNTVLNNENI